MNYRQMRDGIAARIRAAESIEEIDLAWRFLRGARVDGVMIDVGAHTGESFSRFAAAGWEVHAFEPDPRNREAITSSWGLARNVTINPSAVANVDAPEVGFSLSSNTCLSSLSAFDPSHGATIAVPQVSLRCYCREKKLRCIDFLKIDAEGHDFEVLDGFPWETSLPEIVMCEFEDRKRKTKNGFVALAGLLQARGYHLIVSEWQPVESYAGPFRWKRFFAYPGEMPDKDGNGNILAVRTSIDQRRLGQLFRKKRLVSSAATRIRATLAWLRHPRYGRKLA